MSKHPSVSSASESRLPRPPIPSRRAERSTAALAVAWMLCLATATALVAQTTPAPATAPDGLTKPIVEAGAPDLWWSLRPLNDAHPPLPTGVPDEWLRNPVDRFVIDRLQKNGLSPSPKADKTTLIRRVTYNLTGLPPTADQVAQFVDDPSSTAYEQLVERLLASPRYGEHWGRHWLDVVRFGESRGFERNEIIRNAWPFRDYVIRSFNEDRAFDRLILEHIAGDVIGPGDPAVEIGTTFLVCGPYDDVGNQDPAQAAQIRANTIDEMIRATTESFLGLTVGCARCHDHKFDPILQKDYYALYGTFAGVRHGTRILATEAERAQFEAARKPHNERLNELGKTRTELLKTISTRAETEAANASTSAASPATRPRVERIGTEERFAPIRTSRLRLIVEGAEHNPDATTGFNIDEFEVWTAEDSSRNVAAAAAGATAEGASRVAEDFAGAYGVELAIDGQFGARWIASGPELVITFAQPETIHRVFFSSDRSGTASASFVSEYRVEVSGPGAGDPWVEVANSHDREPLNAAHQRSRLMARATTEAERARLAEIDAAIADARAKRDDVPPLPAWSVGNFQAAPGPFHIFIGGNPQRKGDGVVPASLSALSETAARYQLPGDSEETQRRLELARWIVSDANPITPRVLANRVWHYHFGRGIVDTPSDFGANGGEPSHPELLDWLAGFLRNHDWRLKPLHRLIVTSQTYRQRNQHRTEAAAVDGATRLLWRFSPRRLSAEELRDTMLSVAGQLDPAMGGPGFRLYRYLQDNVATYVPLDRHGPETYRRAVYHHNARAASVDLLAEFDCPDNAFPAPRRASTTTPLQALTLMNHSFTIDMARSFAERLLREAPGDNIPSQVRHAFTLAYARVPTPVELSRSVFFVERHGLEPFCRVLLNSNELLYLM